MCQVATIIESQADWVMANPRFGMLWGSIKRAGSYGTTSQNIVCILFITSHLPWDTAIPCLTKLRREIVSFLKKRVVVSCLIIHRLPFSLRWLSLPSHGEAGKSKGQVGWLHILCRRSSNHDPPCHLHVHHLCRQTALTCCRLSFMDPTMTLHVIVTSRVHIHWCLSMTLGIIRLGVHCCLISTTVRLMLVKPWKAPRRQVLSVNLILDATPATIRTPYPAPPPPPYAPAPAKLCRALPCCVLCSLMFRAPKHIVHIISWCYVHPSTQPLGCHQQQQHCCRVDWHGSKASAGAKKLLNRKQSFSVGNTSPSSFAVKSTCTDWIRDLFGIDLTRLKRLWKWNL